MEAPSVTELGVPFTIKATALRPASERLSLDVVRTSTDSFAILGVEEKAAGEEAGAEKTVFKAQVVPLDLGKQSLALVWSFQEGDGPVQAMSTPVALDVTEPDSLKADPQLRDIKPLRRARGFWWLWLLLAAALGAAAWEYRRRRAQPAAQGGAAPAPVDARTPEQRAEDELAALAASGLWEGGRAKEFYLRLTEILRRYLEERRAVPATRRTTTELLRALKRDGSPREAVALLKELFERADLVKFAKVSAEPQWGAEDLETARRFLRQLAPVTAPEAVR